MTPDDDLAWMEECGIDYDHFHANYGDLFKKHKNGFVAVKNLKGLP